MKNNNIHRIILVSFVVLFAGCTHFGERFIVHPLPDGAPSVEAVLTDLAQNDAAIETFRATGAFYVETPEIGQRRFRGRIAYQRPTYLYLRGDHQLGTRLFEMRCAGEEWIIDIPSENQQYRSSGAALYANVPFRVSPFDVALEVFFQEDWSQLDPSAVRLTAFHVDEQIAVLEMRRPHNLRRRIEVKGPPWTVVSSTLLDWRGRTLAVTRRMEHRVIDGIRFPTSVESEFPRENARMSFEFRRPVLNEPVDESLFYIDALDSP